MPQTDQFLSPTSVARLLGVSEGTVRNYNAAGHLHALEADNGRRMYRRSEVEQFAAQRRQEAGNR